MAHELIATTGLAACIALAVHMALPARGRQRVDAALRRLTRALQARLERVLSWRREQRQERAATQEADRVIRRAREAAALRDKILPEGEWEGNVYRPKSFDKPKKPH